MSNRFRAVVRHTKTSFGWAWAASYIDDNGKSRGIAGYAETWKLGMTYAHAGLRTLHDEAMDEVHESRATRRTAVNS